MGVERAWMLFLFPAALVLIYFLRRKSYFTFPSLDTVPEGWGGRVMSVAFNVVPVVLLLVLVLLAAGLRFPIREEERYGYGADIVFILDESGSMLESFRKKSPAEGLNPGAGPSKFSAAKSVIAQFMEKRKTGQDRYGLTVFGSSAIRVLPLSFNHELFLSCLDAQEAVLQATLFYHPLSFALDELIDSTARSRILVLVTDGGGPIEDERYGFSDIVRKYGIRFYWISLETEPFDDLPKFLGKIGPLGKRIDVADASRLEAGFSEIHHAEHSLIVYKASAPAISARPMILAGIVFIALLWGAYALAVYHRGSGIGS
jgi:hypothetical protein